MHSLVLWVQIQTGSVLQMVVYDLLWYGIVLVSVSTVESVTVLVLVVVS